MFDVNKLTLEEVSAELDKTIRKLGRLQKLQEALVQEKHAEIEQLIAEYNRAKREEAKSGKSEPTGV